MSFGKEDFLRTKLIRYLQQMDPATPPRWGNISVQEMVEHYSGEAVRNASGRLKVEQIVTPPEKLEAMREFMMSDHPFKDNTRNSPLNGEVQPLRFNTIQAAIGSLHQELIYFFEAFRQDPQLVTRNPLFGDLNFEQNVQLLYKHALHHLRQFGFEPLNV